MLGQAVLAITYSLAIRFFLAAFMATSSCVVIGVGE